MDNDQIFSLPLGRELAVTEDGMMFFRREDRNGRLISSCFMGRDLDTLAAAVRVAQQRQAEWRASESV